MCGLSAVVAHTVEGIQHGVFAYNAVPCVRRKEMRTIGRDLPQASDYRDCLTRQWNQMFAAHLHAFRAQTPKRLIGVELLKFEKLGEARFLGAHHSYKCELKREL